MGTIMAITTMTNDFQNLLTSWPGLFRPSIRAELGDLPEAVVLMDPRHKAGDDDHQRWMG